MSRDGALLGNGWSNGLFECFGDCGSCCYASFCASCAAGEIWDQGNFGSGGEWDWWIGCCIYGAIVQQCCCLYGMVFTQQLRDKKGIQGSMCGDCVEWTFCPCCVHTRNLREVRGT